MAESFSHLRLGLTMRVVEAAGYTEPRDALAQDWGRFMPVALPGAGWVPIPNLGRDVIAFVQSWGLNGFIFTGGNDLFSCDVRDETETILLAWALERNLPVFGVCRGLQLLAHYYGYPVSPCLGGGHAAVRHKVRLLDTAGKWTGDSPEVNSYHDYCIAELPEHGGALVPFAVDHDGRVEGARHREKRLAAVMWHPEREGEPAAFDLQLIRNFFH